MTNLLNIKNEAEKIRLSSAEKSAMRARLISVMSTPAPSPYVFASLFSYQTRMVLAGFLLFVVAGAGTASAAQGALPGDVLYPVKIAVNEKIEAALATTPTAKAAVEVKLAERRVAEAQTLQAQGRLDAITTKEIEKNFDKHATLALALTPAPSEKKFKASKAHLKAEGHAQATLMLAPAKLEATSTETKDEQNATIDAMEASSTVNQEREHEDVSASIEIQKNILKEIKVRVENRKNNHAEQEENSTRIELHR